MTVYAATLTAVVSSGIILAAVWKLVTNLGKNATTWALVQNAFSPPPGKGAGLVERVAHIEDTVDRIEKNMT